MVSGERGDAMHNAAQRTMHRSLFQTGHDCAVTPECKGVCQAAQSVTEWPGPACMGGSRKHRRRDRNHPNQNPKIPLPSSVVAFCINKVNKCLAIPYAQQL